MLNGSQTRFTASRLVICIVCVMAASVVSTSVASSASADLWVLDICFFEPLKKGEYTNASCSNKAEPPRTGEWEHRLEGMPSSWFYRYFGFLLKVEDKGAGIAMECEIAGEGQAGPEKASSVTKLTASKCVSLKGCEAGTASASPVGLSWNQELYEEGSEVRNKIKVSGTAPGWTLKCRVFGITTTDTCEGETSTHMTDVVEGVEEAFDAKTAAINCSVGGSGAGILAGKGKIETGEKEDFAYIE